MPTNCLLPLIGLTRDGSTCNPLAPDAPADYTASLEGLFMDEAEGLNLVGTGLTTEDLYKKLAAAREVGMAEVKSDLARAFAARLTPVESWRGGLGKVDWSGSAAPGAPATMVLQTKYLPHQALRILSLNLLLDQPITGAQLQLDGVDVGTPFDTTAGPVSVAVDIPLDGQTHTLSVALPETVRARTTKLACSSCGHTRSLDFFLSNASAEVTGISVQAMTVCTQDIVCEAVLYGGEPRRALAYAVLYKAVQSFAIERLTHGAHLGNANQTGLSGEDWKFLIELYSDKYTKMLAWLAQPEGGLKAEESPCFVCRTPTGAPRLVKSTVTNRYV